MAPEKLILRISALTLFYTWAGYPALLFLIRKLSKRQLAMESGLLPFFSIVIAAHNEESQIAAKLEDCLALEYPCERLEIIVASDGSNDRTGPIVEEFAARDPCVRLLPTEGRTGKSSAQNLAVRNARGDVLLFTDAGTRARRNLLTRIAPLFADARVGLVAPVTYFRDFGNAISKSQGAYWRFEIWLRQLESDLGILATASGAAFAVRRNLFRPIPAEFGDDCVVPLDVRLQGYKVLQHRDAIVCDEMPHTIDGELRARARMTARNYGGILCRAGLLNPIRFPGTASGLLSHKLLRWMTPFVLTAMFVTNALLATHARFVWLFVLQCCFYSAALAGWKLSRTSATGRVFAYPFAFCLANVGFFLGTVQHARGSRVIAYK